jgi:hypothetical protein
MLSTINHNSGDFRLGIHDYKFMAVELDLVPVSSGTMLPDLR